MNRKEFENMEDDLRIQYEGFRPGMYVRVEVDQVPCELVTNFDPTYPIIVGGLLAIEENIGCVQVWYLISRVIYDIPSNAVIQLME